MKICKKKKFLEKSNLLKLPQKETENEKSRMESIIITLQQRKFSSSVYFTSKFYPTMGSQRDGEDRNLTQIFPEKQNERT